MCTESNREQQWSFDIRRSILLNAIIQQWSMPAYRVMLNQPDQAIHVEDSEYAMIDPCRVPV